MHANANDIVYRQIIHVYNVATKSLSQTAIGLYNKI